MAGRSKDLVAGAALAGAFGLGGFLFLRAHGALGVSWTDGERTFRSETEERVRHAVWDAPEDLGTLGEATRPTLSPDGRWLVFAAGEPAGVHHRHDGLVARQAVAADRDGGVGRAVRSLLEARAQRIAVDEGSVQHRAAVLEHVDHELARRLFGARRGRGQLDPEHALRIAVGRRQHEEDQHQEHDVGHRGQVERELVSAGQIVAQLHGIAPLAASAAAAVPRFASAWSSSRYSSSTRRPKRSTRPRNQK